MPPNRFESEVESFLEGSHGDRTHIKRADHHTVTPLCGTLLLLMGSFARITCEFSGEWACSYVRVSRRFRVKPVSPLLAQAQPQLKPPSPLRVRNGRFGCVFRL